MSNLDKFRDQITKKIEDMKGNYNDNTIRAKKEEYGQSVSNKIDVYTNKVIGEIFKLKENNAEITQIEVRDELRELYKKSDYQSNTIAADYRDILQQANKAKTIIDELVDIKKQTEIWDWKEKARALLLRILTAIGIASVVLLTSFFAQKWGIPLPLRMGLTG